MASPAPSTPNRKSEGCRVPAKRAVRRPARLRAFARHRKGSTAVEFSLIAIPFFALLFAIFETALVFFVDQLLEDGIARASRMIRTGQVQAQALSESGFKTLICNDIPVIIDCQKDLRVDVRSFPDFSSVNLPPVTDKDGELTNNFTFAPGGAGDVVVVRSYYAWQLLTPPQITGLATMSGNKRLLSATAAFRNEPF